MCGVSIEVVEAVLNGTAFFHALEPILQAGIHRVGVEIGFPAK